MMKKRALAALEASEPPKPASAEEAPALGFGVPKKRAHMAAVAAGAGGADGGEAEGGNGFASAGGGGADQVQPAAEPAAPAKPAGFRIPKKKKGGGPTSPVAPASAPPTPHAASGQAAVAAMGAGMCSPRAAMAGGCGAGGALLSQAACENGAPPLAHAYGTAAGETPRAGAPPAAAALAAALAAAASAAATQANACVSAAMAGACACGLMGGAYAGAGGYGGAGGPGPHRQQSLGAPPAPSGIASFAQQHAHEPGMHPAAAADCGQPPLRSHSSAGAAGGPGPHASLPLHPSASYADFAFAQAQPAPPSAAGGGGFGGPPAGFGAAEPPPPSRQPSAAPPPRRQLGRPSGGGPVPAGWRECAPHGRLTYGLLPMKTFLGAAFAHALPPHAAWAPPMVRQLPLPAGAHVRLVIDLCATGRFYEPSELPPGVAYHKLIIPGRALPPPAAVDEFCAVAAEYLSDARYAKAVVAVHCTHGVNRTGFLIASYLIRRHRLSAREALQAFTAARFPGMWRQELVDALHAQYGGPAPEPAAAPPPWAADGDEGAAPPRAGAEAGGGGYAEEWRGAEGEGEADGGPMRAQHQQGQGAVYAGAAGAEGNGGAMGMAAGGGGACVLAADGLWRGPPPPLDWTGQRRM